MAGPDLGTEAARDLAGHQPLVLDLSQVRAADVPFVGGKAANLGELVGAGLPVPKGFCVTTRAYDSTAAGADLGAVLTALWGTSPSDGPALVALAEQARSTIARAPVPAQVADAVRVAYETLGTRLPVAVRSSATAEDLPFASFAGQQDTYLNVVGAEEVLDAVRRCWASLWTGRAVAYRAVQRIDPRSVRLAVVIQEMVDAAASGVLFTANPVTGRRHEAVIDSSVGLGEAVVSGAVDPDHFVVDVASRTITARRTGTKGEVIEAVPGGGTRRGTPGEAGRRPSLTDEQVLDLAAIGSRVEEHYRAPQDVEWAFDRGHRLWLTQARPITTLFPLPDPRPDDGRIYFCISLAQGLVRPITPMGISAVRVIGSGVAGLAGVHVSDPLCGPAVLVAAGQRLFIDVTDVLRSRCGRAIALRVLTFMEARSAAVLRELGTDARFAVRPDSLVTLVRRLGRIAVHYHVPFVLAQALTRPSAAHRRLAAFERRLVGRLSVPADIGPQARLDHVVRVLGHDLPSVLPTIGPVCVLPGYGMLGLVARLLRGQLHSGELQDVLRGLPHNVTTQMNLRLWSLAVRLRDDAPSLAALLDEPAEELAQRYRWRTLPAVLQETLEEFLERYGHRGVAEIDLGVPRWAEDPSYVLGVLATYVRLDDPALAPDAQFARGAREAGDAVQRLVATARRRGRLRGAVVRFALSRVRELAGLRETPKYLLVVVLSHVRHQLALVGSALVAEGRIGDADDVFFLTLAEARDGLRGQDQHTLVSASREAYYREMRRRHVPRVLLSDGTEPEALRAARVSDGVITGVPASAGTVTGKARVVLDPEAARLEQGEILVAPSTDPGWTPLFLAAGGLVMEMGGPNSHGAVVAREYGIPAVVGVPDATVLIPDGETITVDGGTGEISRGSSRAGGHGS